MPAMSQPLALNLTGHLLIAMPGLEDSLFGGSVVYVCEHSDQGALGLIINKTTDLQARHLFARLDLNLPREDLADMPVLVGGPLHQDRGFVLHDTTAAAPSQCSDGDGGGDGEQTASGTAYASSLPITDGLALTSSRDVMEAISQGGGPRRALMALGCSSWDGGQLESELAANAWLTVPASHALLFQLEPAQRYGKALELLGIHAHQLASMAGHA
ncbi:MAG: YqgE/AlgH family protein [Comamonadaceae bacterium]|nr:YqgE/AlgH family protein [Comamonadaceae bacterium]